jgi:hypothetical protein
MKMGRASAQVKFFLTIGTALLAGSAVSGCVSASNSGGSGGKSASDGGAGGNAGGANGQGSGGVTGSGGAIGGGGSTGSGGGGGAGQGVGGNGGSVAAACPMNAYFCSGFEEATLPVGATYISSNDNNDSTKGLLLDKTVFHAGQQSLKVLPLTAYSQREVSVPAATTFWFRAFLRTDLDIGGPAGTMHNAFFEAMWTTGQQDKGVEIVEEDCELGVNINDTRYGSNGTTNQPGCPTADPKGTILALNAWHCIEGYFDGSKGDFRIFANGAEVITKTGIAGAKQPFSALRFGYREYHAPRERNTWFDDVVVAPQRIGCP